VRRPPAPPRLTRASPAQGRRGPRGVRGANSAAFGLLVAYAAALHLVRPDRPRAGRTRRAAVRCVVRARWSL
jgi:hypothetical protein